MFLFPSWEILNQKNRVWCFDEDCLTIGHIDEMALTYQLYDVKIDFEVCGSVIESKWSKNPT